MGKEKIVYRLRKEDLPTLRTKKGRRVVKRLPSRWRPAGKVFVIGDASALAVPAGRIWSFFYDGKTERKKVGAGNLEKIRALSAGKRILIVNNPRGEITAGLWRAVKESVRVRCAVFVRGEEDLAALAMIAAAPLGSTVVYGMPGEGLAILKIGKANKRVARRLLSWRTA